MELKVGYNELMKRSHLLDPRVENKIKQIIFSDLINQQYGDCYKLHTQRMISWVQIVSQELGLCQSDQKVLITAAYAYHWGCGNLYHQPFVHLDSIAKHKKKCFQLASSKIERFLGYNLSRFFSQNEMLLICNILEDQVKDISKMSTLAVVLNESALIAWVEMLADNELSEEYLNQVEEYLATSLSLVSNSVSKQILATFNEV